MSEQRISYRLDFTIEVTECDDATRTVTMLLKPDPRRYEWRGQGDEEYLYDRFDKLAIPKAAFQELTERASGLPLTFESPKIDDATVYVESRREAILRRLDGNVDDRALADPSSDLLSTLKTDAHKFVILSMDLVGSTELASHLPARDYLRIVQSLLAEAAGVIHLFNGHVLKYTGDGVIAYFPSPTFITKNDHAVDCALTLLRLVRDALNPAFTQCALPTISVRVGIDSGEAAVVMIGDERTKAQNDVVGTVVNLACKIQAQAPPDCLAIGDITLRNLHTHWRLQFVELDTGADWPYRDSETRGRYHVHVLRPA